MCCITDSFKKFQNKNFSHFMSGDLILLVPSARKYCSKYEDNKLVLINNTLHYYSYYEQMQYWW